MDKVTIRQAAEILQCSQQTIRRKITKGEIPAHKEKTEFGDIWYISSNYINKTIEPIGVVPIKDDNISIAEIKNIITASLGQAIESTVKKVITEQTDPLRIEIQKLRNELNAHNQRVDEQLRAAVSKTPPKTFWQKIWGR